MVKLFVSLFVFFGALYSQNGVITSSKNSKEKIVYVADIPSDNFKFYYVQNFEALRKKRAKHGDVALVKFPDKKETRYVNANGKFWRLKNPREVVKFPLNTKYFFKSCLRILKNNPKIKSGFYTIDSDGTGSHKPFKVYCDMKSDGGGWTRFLKYRDSVAYNKVKLTRSEKFVSNGYKITIYQALMDYKELMLNGCRDKKITMILPTIPDYIVTDWIESEAKNGVTKSTHANACLKRAKAKDGKLYYYGTDLSSKNEFETLHFSTKCLDGVNGASTTVWGAVDAGNSYRQIWGSVNGLPNKWKHNMRYHNDYICAHVR